MDVDELLVVGGVFAHVGYDARADRQVFTLVAVDLVGEGIEEAVAWKHASSVSNPRAKCEYRTDERVVWLDCFDHPIYLLHASESARGSWK